MSSKLIRGAALSLALPLVLASTGPSFAARPAANAAQAAVTPPMRAVLAEKRAAVQGVSADAMAVLAAIQADPSLVRNLARNPQGAEALLRARGATRAEHITVTPAGDGANRTITITITIDHVVITIRL